MESKLANTIQSKKRVRQSEKNRIYNMSRRSTMRSMIKKTIKSIKDKDIDLAKKNFNKLQSILDTYAIKGIIHKNNAARNKSRINSKIKKISIAH